MRPLRGSEITAANRLAHPPPENLSSYSKCDVLAMNDGPGGDAETEPKAKVPRKKGEQKKHGGGAAKMFPTLTFEEALELGLAIQQHAAGQKVRRLTLFDKMGRKSSTGPSRHLITSSGKYGITGGSYAAELLALTPDGVLATSPDAKPREQAAARFRLAIDSIDVFKGLYERLKGNKIPSREVLSDYAGELDVPEDDRLQCVDIFLGNAKFVRVLKVLSGAERVVTVDHMLDELPAGATTTLHPPLAVKPPAQQAGGEPVSTVDFSKVCFFITPIGDEGSEHRKHSDMMLGSLIEKALEGQDLHVIRADRISKPGMISAQVIDYVLRSRVVVADLSYHNPNVFSGGDTGGPVKKVLGR